MVKLASARDSRLYGPWRSRNRFEYVNAGLYLFSSIVLLTGFLSQLSKEPKSGLVLLFMALAIIFFVNVHDLIAHIAGIDCRLPLMEFDLQLALVEFAAPLVQAAGSLLMLLAVFFLFMQEEKGYVYWKLEKHALNMLVAGPVLWLLGSVHNSCQIYERADGHVQMLQQSVHIPFLMGSLLLLVGAIMNLREQEGSAHHGRELMGRSLTWFGIFGSAMLAVGGFGNVVKVFKMQQGQVRLEKLRGGADELLDRERDRDGQVVVVPLILEEQRRRRRQQAEELRIAVAEQAREETAANANANANAAMSTPYKDVLVGQT